MFVCIKIKTLFLHPFFEPIRSRENTNSFFLLEPVSGFRSDNPSIVIQPFLNQRSRWNPEFADLRSAFHLVFVSMFQIEKSWSAANMIVVQVRKGHDFIFILV